MVKVARLRVVQSTIYPDNPGKLSVRTLDGGSIRSELGKYFEVGDEVVVVRLADFESLMAAAGKRSDLGGHDE